MDGEAIKPQQPKMVEQRPRHVWLRASLENAAEQDAKLKASARSIKAEERQQAFELPRAVANSDPPNAVGPQQRQLWVAADRSEQGSFRVQQWPACVRSYFLRS